MLSFLPEAFFGWAFIIIAVVGYLFVFRGMNSLIRLKPLTVAR